MRNLFVLAVAAAATYYAARALEVPARLIEELARTQEALEASEELTDELLRVSLRSRHARLFAELPEPHEVRAAFDLGRD